MAVTTAHHRTFSDIAHETSSLCVVKIAILIKYKAMI
jgi:hypothetical protein